MYEPYKEGEASVDANAQEKELNLAPSTADPDALCKMASSVKGNAKGKVSGILMEGKNYTLKRRRSCYNQRQQDWKQQVLGGEQWQKLSGGTKLV